MRILVTGGAGFLGSHLCDRLITDGHEVVCLDNFFTGSRRNIEHLTLHHSRRFDLMRHDVCEPFVVECDQVYHLACPASPVHYQRNPARTIKTGVLGTLNVLDMAREVKARVFIASTSEIYGDPKEHPQTEAYWGNVNPVGPRACYDESKRCAESLAVCYAKEHGVDVRIARIFNTYGPRMHPNDGRVVSNFITQALAGKPMTIFGDGTQTRSFCYVSDLIEAFVRFMAQDADKGPMNLGNPREIRVTDLAEKIRIRIGKAEVVRLPLPVDDPTRRRPDIRRAQAAFGWQPVVPIEDGLDHTISYFKGLMLLCEVTGCIGPVVDRFQTRCQDHYRPPAQFNGA
jgi:UDP-glucuronate decarboxylase